MSAEFVDTNLLVYAHDSGAGRKHKTSVALFTRLFEERTGVLSIQVLSEFYNAATRKLRMASEEAEEVIRDLQGWTVHRPGPADLLRAAQLSRRYQISWWDALIVNSAIASGCDILWSEDLAHGQLYEALRVHNPFLSDR